MRRIVITMNEAMHKDLKDLAEKQGATISGLVRLYIADRLIVETGGDKSKYKVDRGGYRGEKSDSE